MGSFDLDFGSLITGGGGVGIVAVLATLYLRKNGTFAEKTQREDSTIKVYQGIVQYKDAEIAKVNARLSEVQGKMEELLDTVRQQAVLIKAQSEEIISLREELHRFKEYKTDEQNPGQK